jgi:rSAM/selenodomain-associated transferase 2
MTRICVIIPALNEEAALPAVFKQLSLSETDEVVVVDGGSRDSTVAIAQAYGAKVVHSQSGRAIQFNTGAKAVSDGSASRQDDVFLFLHADTCLPEDGLDAIRKAMSRQAGDGKFVGGAFRLAIEPATFSLGFIANIVNLRSRWLHLPYGDQALFVRRGIFEKLNGFTPMPIMEDVDFVKRLRMQGQVVLLKQKVVTSARRWLANGPWRTTWTNWRAIWKYHRGESADSIRVFYDRKLANGK